jgi:hypothetical protein
VSPEEHADNRLGYEAALALMTYEGGLIWAKFNAMLVANGFVLAIAGATAAAKSTPTALQKAVAVGGLVLCALWANLISRGFDQYVYWILSAREVEEQALAPAVQTLSRGAAFAAGRAVPLSIDSQLIHHRMSLMSRSVTARQNAYLIITVFGALYVVALAV